MSSKDGWQVTPHMPCFDDWTEDETVRLLDAILLCGENWDVVAQYVGGKTMEQCVLHFARLPIADSYVEDAYPQPQRSLDDKHFFQSTLPPKKTAEKGPLSSEIFTLSLRPSSQCPQSRRPSTLHPNCVA